MIIYYISFTSKIKIGDVFGRLTVVEKTDRRKRGAVIWKCKCSCGNLTETKTDYLQQGWTKSCGCLNQEQWYKNVPRLLATNPKKIKSKKVYKFNGLFSSYKSNAYRRGLEFNLTHEDVYKVVKDPCFYCNYSPKFIETQEIDPNNYSQYSCAFNGMDRVDSTKGYTVDNIVSCCTKCNIAKHTMTQEDYFNWIERSYKNLFKGEK